ncbi:Alcohol dehydrogenase, class IV [Variovorax sp. YR266]|uniref:iron-containing alcohol dehydrogenase family protein n=1 Tax=Variovorax sp. YR266 TaxID=1884386 RepID=UPI000895326C|nr:iron-containing alcohol dehydrogenase family protein [Variovorax sp. YR266]SDZ70854.1 Alcohol dehydrogenase, class IV [Variovorax sp. YR266]
MRRGQHFVPALRLFDGADSLAALHGELARVGSLRAVVFCGASLVREGAALDTVRRAMGDRCAGVFAGVKAHSPLDDVEVAVQELKRLRADAVVAVGGGSAVVTARAASILLAEPGDARDLCTVRNGDGALFSPRLQAPKLAQLVVPTTPTTATLKAGSAVLDPVDGKRLALFDPKTRAQAVFVHPDLLKTPPGTLVISAALNTLAMALEGLMSLAGDPFSDGLLMHATRLIAQGLAGMGTSDEAAARSDLMFASLMCGHATDYTGAGIAIPLGHAVSARFHVDNGFANAILLPHVVRFNAQAAISGLAKLAAALGRPVREADPADAVIQALDQLLEQLCAPRRLRDIGVTRASLPELAEISMDDWFVQGNPRPVRDASELLSVLTNAW